MKQINSSLLKIEFQIRLDSTLWIPKRDIHFIAHRPVSNQLFSEISKDGGDETRERLLLNVLSGAAALLDNVLSFFTPNL